VATEDTFHSIKGEDMSGTISAGDLALGLSVTGSDGSKVGVVNEVIENPSMPPASAGSFYFEVNQGGILGIGATHLYIPVEVVQSVGGEHGVALDCTAEEARQKYKRRPDEA
jgi:hypothetical protein